MTPISPNANKKKKEGMSSNCLFELPYSSGHLIAWVNRRHLETLPPVSRAKWRLRNERRNCILMTRHYRDLGSASGWLNQISHAARPVRSTTQIWVVTRHQYGISVLVSQTSFGGELPVVASPNVGCFLRLVIWQWGVHPVYLLVFVFKGNFWYKKGLFISYPHLDSQKVIA